MNFLADTGTPFRLARQPVNSLDACPPPRELRPGKPVDAEWLQWIAENRLRNCTPESMLVTMCGAGLDRAEAEARHRAHGNRPRLPGSAQGPAASVQARIGDGQPATAA
jgi:hypothetical protein